MDNTAQRVEKIYTEIFKLSMELNLMNDPMGPLIAGLITYSTIDPTIVKKTATFCMDECIARLRLN